MAEKRASTREVLSISGLSPAARDTIAKAARKRRRSVNAWAAETLEGAARRTLAGAAAGDGGSDEVLAQLKRISRKLDRLAAQPSPMEKSLDQMQKSIHDVGVQLGTVYDQMRARSAETVQEVRGQTDSVVEQISERSGEAFAQWRKAAGEALGDLQRNLNDLQKKFSDASGFAHAPERGAGTRAAPSSRTPARPRSAPKSKAAKPAGAKPKVVSARAKPASAKAKVVRARAKPAARPGVGRKPKPAAD